jgi:hypothetical protein
MGGSVMVNDDLEARLRKLQEDASRLEEKQRELEQDLKDIDHQTRRWSDRVERGENTPAVDASRRQLDERRRLNIDDQQSTSRDLETLRRQREEIEDWLRRMRGGGGSGRGD